jgi:hypothetical protein
MKNISTYIKESIINETSIHRLMTKHADVGYIIISACRNDKTVEENNKATKELEAMIKDENFTFTSVKGGFVENLGKENERVVEEKSFIIFNYFKSGYADRTITREDTRHIREFGEKLCNKFNQDSFLYCEPGKNPQYITKNGSVDFELDKSFTIDNQLKEYFTKLGNHQFTFNDKISECEQPQTLNKRMSMSVKNQMFL